MLMSDFIIPLGDPRAADPMLCGPKTANQAALAHGGLPTPGGFCLSAEAYNHQLKSLGLLASAEKAVTLDFMESRNYVSEVRIALFSKPMVPEILDPLLEAYRELVEKSGNMLAVRSSSLMEDTEGSSFAGQFQTFLGIDKEDEFITSVRACWGALWSSRAMRYMDGKDINPTDTAMAVLVQRVLEHQVVEVRFVRRQKHNGVLLAESLDAFELCAVVGECRVVTLGVEESHERRHDVDDEGAVGCGDFAQVSRGLALDRVRSGLGFASQQGEAAPKGWTL